MRRLRRNIPKLALVVGLVVGCSSDGDDDDGEATSSNGEETTTTSESSNSPSGSGTVTFTATDTSCEIAGEGEVRDGADIAVTFVNSSSVTLTITIRDESGEPVASTTGFLDPGEEEHSEDYGLPAGEYTTGCTHMQGEPTWSSDGTGTTPSGAAPPAGAPLVVESS